MSAPHVYQAINEVTAVMAKEGIAKTQTNAQQGYKFRGIDNVFAAVSGHLAAAKLCILPRVVERSTMERPTKTGGVSTYTTLTVDFDLVSAVDGSTHTIRTVGEAMDTADKSSNKSMSAAMKYAIILAFQIPTEGDNDADAHTPEPAPRRVVNSGFADPNVATVMETYAASIASAPDVKGLMAVYKTVVGDPRLAPDARDFIQQKLTTRRRELEGRAA